MPYDPNYPQDGQLIEATDFRNQFHGIVDLIQSIPVGAPGPPGQDGNSVATATVDNVTTLNPGDPVAVAVSYDAATAGLHFSFSIPRGNDGSNGSNGKDGAPFTNFVIESVNMLDPSATPSAEATFDGTAVRLVFNIPRGFNGNDGMNGNNGSDGGIGPVGPAGPAVANAVIDSVTTLDAGESATVNTVFDGATNLVHFSFGIPRGLDGTNGTNGVDGSNGLDGEVSNAALASAISGTSNNSNGVAALGLTVSDPPTQSELQQVADKLDELINALRR
jgi:hypothetical protein